MKQIEMLIGSPRKDGNTLILGNYLRKQLQTPANNVHVSFLYDYDIKPCIDCRACKSGEQRCTLDDDADIVVEKIEGADVLIFGTPVYWFGPTGKTKLFIDRLRPYYANKKLGGKNAALIIPAGSGAEDCDLTIEMFKRIFSALEINFIGSVTSKSYDAGDANDDLQAMRAIADLATKIDAS